MPQNIIETVPTGSERNEWLLKHLSAVDAGENIPYFKTKDNDFLYFEKGEVNKKTGQIRYGLVSLTKKKARNARSKALRENRLPSIELYEKIFGFEKGGEIFKEEAEKLNLKYRNPDPSKYDIDHLGSKKELYPELARNLNPQLSQFNRQEGVRKLTPDQENALRVVANDLETSIQLQGPELTQKQTDQVMRRIDGGKTNDLNFDKGSVKFRGARAIPLIGLGVATYVAGGQALAGDLVGAGGTLLDEAVSEVGLDSQPAASGTLTDAPAQHQAILERQANPTVADKIIKDPLNELEYAGKQVMSFFGGAIRMASPLGL
jgi:hypothetical protein